MTSPPHSSRTPPRASFGTPTSPRTSPGQSLSKALELEEDYLFNSPPELVSRAIAAAAAAVAATVHRVWALNCGRQQHRAQIVCI